MTAAQESALQQHPLSAAFPSMAEVELQALAIDIETHGQREPAVLLEGMVLDGWHRFLACGLIGTRCRFEEFKGSDPVAFVISRNLHRRHLTASQRAQAVVSANEWRPFGDQRGGVGKSTDQLAKSAEVSEKTIRHAKDAQRAGLGDEVREGKVSAHTAAAVSKLPKAKREKAMAAIKAGEEPKLPKPKAVVAGREVEKLYEAVKADLADYKERYETLGETARELQDKLEMYEAVEPDEQQKKIAALQKTLQRKDGEIARQRGQISDLNNKCNALIRQVRSLETKK